VLYELALQLRTPVYVLENEMPYEEFTKWLLFFEQKPIGWREDDRTYKLLRAQGVEAKPGELFSSLQALQQNTPKREKDEIDTSSFKKSTLFSKMLSAKGGDRVLDD